MPAKMDFKGLSTSEIRKLHDQTTKLYVQQRDKAARQVTSKPGTDDGWGAHSLPGGGVCTCDNPKSHFAPLENERYYQSQQGHMVRLEPGEEPPTERGGAFETLDARMIRELEQMPDSAIQKLSYDQQAELAEFQGARTEQIAAEFIGLRPAYYPVADNYIALLNQLCETYLLQPLANDDEETLLRAEMKLLQRGVFTARHLALAYDALAAEGALFAKPGTRKPLSPAQLRQLTAMCGMDRSIGGLEKALQLYLEYAGCEEDWKDVAENPDYADVYEDAMVWIFSQVQADFRPTPEIRDFLRQYIGDRAPTIALLQHAWLACKEQEGNVTGFEELPATPEDTVAASSTRQFLSQPSDPDIWWTGGQVR